MTDRRTFVKTASLAVAGLAIGMKGYPASLLSTVDFTSMRPFLKERKFRSKAVEEIITTVKKAIANPELAWLFERLKLTHAGTGFMHESFFKDDATQFTRKWFAWANTLFGEMILKGYHECPHLLKQTF